MARRGNSAISPRCSRSSRVTAFHVTITALTPADCSTSPPTATWCSTPPTTNFGGSRDRRGGRSRGHPTRPFLGRAQEQVGHPSPNSPALWLDPSPPGLGSVGDLDRPQRSVLSELRQRLSGKFLLLLTAGRRHRGATRATHRSAVASARQPFLESRSAGLFDRPERSPCLASLTDQHLPAYQEALGLIRAGRDRLAGHPESDMPGFQASALDQWRRASTRRDANWRSATARRCGLDRNPSNRGSNLRGDATRRDARPSERQQERQQIVDLRRTQVRCFAVLILRVPLHQNLS